MVEPYLRQDGLSHLGLLRRATSERGEAGVTMAQRRFPAIVNLRGAASDKDFAAAVRETLDAALPTEPNTVTQGSGATLLWLGPDEWWVVSDETAPDTGPNLAARLRAALEHQHCAVTEVGESRVCLRVSGPRARDLLAKGMSLDLHPRSFGGAGRCAQSNLAKALVVVHQTAEDEAGAPHFEIYVLRSFADYLWRWLEDAAQEYGLQITGD